MTPDSLNLATLLIAFVTGLFAAGSLWAAVHYGRRALTEARQANALARERSVVEWSVHREDEDNPGAFFAVNRGQDTAFEVTLTAADGTDEVTAEMPEVAPYREGESADCIRFRLPHRERTGPGPVIEPPSRIPRPDPPPGSFRDYLDEASRQHDEMIAREVDNQVRRQVWVRITWRSELGRWSTEKLRTG